MAVIIVATSWTRLLVTGQYAFNDMMIIIHMDEKWLDAIETNPGFYLLLDEEKPHRAAKNKLCISKFISVAIVARPLVTMLAKKNCTVGCQSRYFPFVFQQASKRNSKNRVVDTIETNIVQAIERRECLAMLVDKISECPDPSRTAYKGGSARPAWILDIPISVRIRTTLQRH